MVKLEKATFAAGCFWGVEEEFRKLPGVVSTAAGYTGGKTAKPTYEDVCSDTTGHAEAVEIEFDPRQISFGKLLDIFFACHNPTMKNRQGPDVGTQYRSTIFFHGKGQEKIARESMARLAKSGKWGSPIATEIVPAGKFWKAEEYHQKYLLKRGQASCRI